jgi:hypothetical protein
VGLHPCLQLVTQTHDRRLAEQWLAMLPSVEGVVAKRADGRYSAGRQHAWIKVKRQRTVDCVVIGVAGDNASPRLVLGLRRGDQELHDLGRLTGDICHLGCLRRSRLHSVQRSLFATAGKRRAGIQALRRCSSVRQAAISGSPTAAGRV